jgi:hypothetical protein
LHYYTHVIIGAHIFFPILLHSESLQQASLEANTEIYFFYFSSLFYYTIVVVVVAGAAPKALCFFKMEFYVSDCGIPFHHRVTLKFPYV